MSTRPFTDLEALATFLRLELQTKQFFLLCGYNGTGKTRLSGRFKNIGKEVNIDGETTKRARSISMPSQKTFSIGTTTSTATASAT